MMMLFAKGSSSCVTTLRGKPLPATAETVQSPGEKGGGISSEGCMDPLGWPKQRILSCPFKGRRRWSFLELWIDSTRDPRRLVSKSLEG